MGVIALGPETIASGGAVVELSLDSPLGLVGDGLVVSIALIALLAYLDLLKSAAEPRSSLERTLLAGIIPLFVTFAGVVLLRSLVIL